MGVFDGLIPGKGTVGDKPDGKAGTAKCTGCCTGVHVSGLVCSKCNKIGVQGHQHGCPARR